MAKVKGIIPIVGTIGGINFYYRKGELIARKAGGGFNGEAIKTSPRMVRVREQNSEFANCSAVNKVFKLALKPMLTGYKDGTLHSRLMSLFLKIKTLDGLNKRGKRTVASGLTTTFGKKLLTDFDFTPKRTSLIPAYTSFDWITNSFIVNGFDINRLAFPANASFMELALEVVRFDFENLTFTKTQATPYIISKSFDLTSFSMHATTPDGNNGLLFAVARVSFYQEVNSNAYLLPGEGNFGIKIVSINN